MIKLLGRCNQNSSSTRNTRLKVQSCEKNEGLRIRNELRSLNREGANGELENLKPLRGTLDLQISRFRRVNRKYSLPRRRVGAGFLQRHRYEIGIKYAGLDFLQRLREVRFHHLLYRPSVAAEAAGGCSGAERAPEIHFAENEYIHILCIFIWVRA